MCGLCGYIADKPTSELSKIARGLLIANQERGTDSTGVACVNGADVTVLKRAVSANEFIADKWGAVETINPAIMLGHTRYAVIGAVTDRNAQPFTTGKITGTHNGVINNYAELEKVEVDSEVIFKRLDTIPDKSKALKALSGSLAIAWHDTNDKNAVYLLRHKNPLSVASVGHAWVWSSERYPLEAILASHYNPDQYKIYELEENMIYRLDTMGKVRKQRVKFKKETYSPYFNTGWYGWGGHNNYTSPANDVDNVDDNLMGECDYCGMPIVAESSFYYSNDGGFYCDKCGINVPHAKKGR